MRMTKESIAESSKLIWEYCKENFPQGAINVRRKNETETEYVRRFPTVSAYTEELDSNDELLVEKHCPRHLRANRKELKRFVNDVLPGMPNYYEEKISFSKYLAEKYKGGVCGEMVRLSYNYGVNDNNAPSLLKEQSYTHIQIVNPRDRADTYHEILVIGLTDESLQAFLNKDFDQCGDAVVVDFWSKDRYYARQFPQKLDAFYDRHKNGIARGLKEQGCKLYNYQHRQAATPAPALVGSLTQPAAFFDLPAADAAASNRHVPGI